LITIAECSIATGCKIPKFIRASQMGEVDQAAGILTQRRTSLQLRDSAGLTPNFPHYFQQMLPVGTDSCIIIRYDRPSATEILLCPKFILSPLFAMNSLPSGERYLYQLFSSIEMGDLTVINPQGEKFSFGKVGSMPQLCLVIHNPKTYDRILTYGALGFCEAYMEGWWDERNNHLVELIGLFHRNGVYNKANGKFAVQLALKAITQRLLTLPTVIQNSRKNVQHHYDLGNDFYQQFLDPMLTYSCSYRLRETDSLEQMQRQKYELICRKLALKSGKPDLTRHLQCLTRIDNSSINHKMCYDSSDSVLVGNSHQT
jgi:Mycolic acid cyclopropane synthetase